MNSDSLNEKLFDALLEAAVCGQFQQTLDHLNWDGTKKHAYSPAHAAAIRRLLQKHHRTLAVRHMLGAAKKAAVVALVVLSVFFAGIMSVGAIRSEIVHLVVEWYEKYVDASFQTDLPGTASPANNLPEEGLMLPSYLPEGYEQVQNIQNAAFTIVICRNTEGTKLTFLQRPLAGGTTLLDNEEHTVEDIQVGGYDGLLSLPKTDGEYASILWRDASSSFQLTGALDRETLIRIAESLQPAE